MIELQEAYKADLEEKEKMEKKLKTNPKH